MYVRITDYTGVHIFQVSNVHTVMVNHLGLWSAGHYTQVFAISRVRINRFHCNSSERIACDYIVT